MFMQMIAYAHEMEVVQSQSTACLPPSANSRVSIHGLVPYGSSWLVPCKTPPQRLTAAYRVHPQA